ncbi:hypothetical protein ACPOL_5743 [Acidisarcina polymorpha]|uniref:Heme chaperone HemW n=1 Tax=Acidisarcina polymorpha TaxID=2211140 RepID=A0A2Z5G7P1_9BACT|nr:radical SAM family heme chaperone HemW [Acidisarcina polymorpha]AXC14989.1 hypothetical protein ACPOL_5743 [Acidisarcina polymorpha]
METLGIYISVPFCRSKCSYCNFASGVFPESYQQRYVDRLLSDIREIGIQAAAMGVSLPRVVNSLYFGGGTPSILAPALLHELFAVLRSGFRFSADAEITMECAPGQLADDVLAGVVECGVNRFSFGVQSFVDREASSTGRLHNRATALCDIERVLAAGIRSVNADLIAGLPHQTAESWRESLEVLLASGVDHASVYMLEVDEDSRLGRELIERGSRYHAASVPSDDQTADFYLEAVEVLNRNGLTQYEISNFARPGTASIHNKKYWQRQPYVGFGLDAHSMLRADDGNPVRFRMGDDMQGFLNGSGFAEVQPVPRSEALEEAWFLGLRMNDGVALRDLVGEFGTVAICSHDSVLNELSSTGLLEINDGRVRLTDRGRLLSNEVFESFLVEKQNHLTELVTID